MIPGPALSLQRSPALLVERARLRGGSGPERARLVKALERVTPAATGVPESALLVIRRLAMGRPLGRDAEPFATGLVEAVRARLLGARHFTHGFDGEGDCYFPDMAAFEAAFVLAALDAPRALAGLVRMAGGEAPLLRWRRHILPDPYRLPEVIAGLVEHGVAPRWLASFEPGELSQAGARILELHGASHEPPGNACPSSARDTGAAATTLSLPPAVRTALHVTRYSAGAGGPVARLLFIALTAVERPDMLGSRAFARALSGLDDRPATAARADERHSARARTAAQVHLRREGKAGPAGFDRSLGRTRGIHAAHGPPDPEIPFAAASQPMRETPDDGQARAHGKPGAEAAAIVNEEVSAVVSDFAGLFFLVNVFTALGLYGDFANPAKGLIGLSPWELLLLLGRRWLGTRFAVDPLSGLLHELAGIGPRTRPGRHFEPPSWRVPEAWLAPWPAARPVRRCGRLWHPAGFPLADASSDASAKVAVARRRWHDALALFLAARIARALAEDDRQQALALLLRQPGAVTVMRERVEVTFDIEAHPLAIRLAGLDADPGWLPSAARDLRFRFQ